MAKMMTNASQVSQVEDGIVLMWGDVPLPLAALPRTSVLALLRRGINHVYGNEAAAKASTKAKKHEAESRAAWIAEHPNEAPSEADEKGFAPSEDQREAWKSAAQAEFLEQIREGTIGIAAQRGPSADPMEKAISGIVRERLQKLLSSAGLKRLPKGDEVVHLQNGQTRTYEQMASNHLAKFGEEIRLEAKRIVSDAERRAKRVEADAKKLRESGVGLEELGI